MPELAITKIAAFLVTLGATTTVATFVASVFVYAAVAFLLNRLSQPKRRGVGLGSGTETNYYDSGASIRIIYGEVRVGGMETIPATLSGNYDELLHKVLTIAGHEVHSFGATYFDQIAVNSIGPMAFTSSDGAVGGSDKFSGHAWVRRYRGTSTDSADRLLCDVNSTRFGRSRAPGIAKAAITLKHNMDIYKAIPTVTFVIMGKRCYDPRLDTSPGANPTNPLYAVWTDNPALCLTDFLMAQYGGGYEATEIDWATVVTAANYCEELVDTAAGGTRRRYTCNGVLFASDDFTDNVRALVDAMLGRVMFRDGKWRVFAGGWQAPTFTVERKDWVSGLNIKFEQGRTKRFNRMRCWYVDKNRDWQRVECLPRTNPTYQTADGNEPIDRETEQLLCTNEDEAQAKAEMLLRQSRNQILVVGRLPPRFQDIALWDTGTLGFEHLGWSSKTFRCVGIDLNEDGSMDCAFLEEQSADWADLDSSEYNVASTTALPITNETRPSEPLGFSATPQLNGTILFNWNRPIVMPHGTEIQIIRSTNSVDAAVGTVVWQGLTRPLAIVVPNSDHWYYGRAISNSLVSAYSPNTYGVHGKPHEEADSTRFSRVTPDAEFTLSQAMSYWVWNNTPNTGISLTGGEFGGRFQITATTPAPSTTLSALNAGVHAIDGQPYRWVLRVRRTTPVSNFTPAIAVQMQVRVRAVNTINVSSGPLASIAGGGSTLVNISSLELNTWTTFTSVVSVQTDTTSFMTPWVAAQLTLNDFSSGTLQIDAFNVYPA